MSTCTAIATFSSVAGWPEGSSAMQARLNMSKLISKRKQGERSSTGRHCTHVSLQTPGRCRQRRSAGAWQGRRLRQALPPPSAWPAWEAPMPLLAREPPPLLAAPHCLATYTMRFGSCANPMQVSATVCTCALSRRPSAHLAPVQVVTASAEGCIAQQQHGAALLPRPARACPEGSRSARWAPAQRAQRAPE